MLPGDCRVACESGSVREYAPDSDAEEPFYLPLGDEIAMFEAAYHNRLPVLLKGPIGARCSKRS